jgi:aconitase A
MGKEEPFLVGTYVATFSKSGGRKCTYKCSPCLGNWMTSKREFSDLSYTT